MRPGPVIVTHNTYNMDSGGRSSYNGGYGSTSRPAPRRESPTQRKGKKVAIVILLILAVILFAVAMMPRDTGVGANITNREKLELGYGYPSDTVTDELDWIANPNRLNRNLKEFYETTGAIPYVALVYRPEITAQGSDAEWEYANDWYTENLPNEGYVLFMYFDPGTGEDGNGQLVVGDQAGILMDAEAQQVFWDNMDNLWTQDIDEDVMFTKAFVNTGNRIMQQRTESGDVVKWIFMALSIMAAVYGIILIMSLRRKHEAERAAETERILSSPLSGSGGNSGSDDPLLDQYSNSDGSGESDM